MVHFLLSSLFFGSSKLSVTQISHSQLHLLARNVQLNSEESLLPPSSSIYFYQSKNNKPQTIYRDVLVNRDLQFFIVPYGISNDSLYLKVVVTYLPCIVSSNSTNCQIGHDYIVTADYAWQVGTQAYQFHNYPQKQFSMLIVYQSIVHNH